MHTPHRLRSHQLDLLFALGVALALVAAGSARAGDSDSDGVDDSFDNCVAVANASQLDVNGDGLGNRCDADFNDDCFVDSADSSLFVAALGGTNLLYDLNGDGVVNTTDFSIFTSYLNGPPGPSASGCGISLFGADLFALGGAVLTENPPGELVVSNIGSSGLDGVAVDVPSGGVDPSFFSLESDVSLQTFGVPAAGAGDALEVNGTLVGGGGVLSELFTLTTDATATVFEMSPDFTSIGATSWRGELYLAGNLVDSQSGHVFGVKKYKPPKNPGVDRHGRIKCPRWSPQQCQIVIELPTASNIDTDGGGVFLADEIRFVAEGATSEVALVTRIELTAHDFGGFTVQSFSISPIPAPVPVMAPVVGTLVLGSLIVIGVGWSRVRSARSSSSR